MKLFSIYKATNKINGKIYIGYTNNYSKRKRDHKYEAVNNNYKYNFHHAIRKYGWNNFDWEVICQSLDGEYLLKEMEPYFIKYYDSFGKNGYNMTLGGGSCVMTEETKLKISNSKRGIKQSEETKKKKSLSLIGRTYSNETLEKMSKSAKNRNYIHTHSNETKKLISKNTKLYICPKCNKRGKGNIMLYWHFNNCKKN